jgi:hypothetical protein
MKNLLKEHYQNFARQAGRHFQNLSPIQRQQAIREAVKRGQEIIQTEKAIDAMPDVNPCLKKP